MRRARVARSLVELNVGGYAVGLEARVGTQNSGGHVAQITTSVRSSCIHNELRATCTFQRGALSFPRAIRGSSSFASPRLCHQAISRAKAISKHSGCNAFTSQT